MYFSQKPLYKQRKIVYNYLYSLSIITFYIVTHISNKFNCQQKGLCILKRIHKSAGVVVIVLLLVITVILALWYKSHNKPFETQTFLAMDTAVTVKAIGVDINACKELLQNLNDELDAYKKDSTLYTLNRNGNGESEIIAELLAEVKKTECQNVDITSGKLIELWSEASEQKRIPTDSEIESALSKTGLDNVSVNGNEITLSNDIYLNFGSCAKGYACDKLKEYFEECGAECAIVSHGSSSLFYGKKPDGTRFSTAITNPFEPSKTVLTVETDNCFISTSGAYERYYEIDGKRYGHIFDLKTGYPVETDLSSVTVICDSGIASDILSTEIFIGGTKDLQSHLNNNSYSVIAIDGNKNIYVSPNIQNDVALSDISFNLIKTEE